VTQVRASHIRGEISSVLSRERIESLSREMGVVRRLRKFGVVEFVWTLALGFARDRRKTLEGFRRVYLELTGRRLARSSFYRRFTPELSAMLKQLAVRALGEQGAQSRAQGTFARFSQVLCADSCIMKLHDALRERCPGVWQPASLKLTAVVNVVGRSLVSYSTHSGRTADVRILRRPSGLRGKLLIFDLGFYQTLLFGRIDRQGGYFLSRLKKNSRVDVTASHRVEHECLKGKSLRDELQNVTQRLVDVTTKVSYVDHLLGKNRKQESEFRVVASLNESTGVWHQYITNAPPEMLAAEHVTAAYAARWEIELLFRELQSDYRLGQFPTKNLEIVHALISATALSLVVSRRLRRFIAEVACLAVEKVPIERWARLFRGVAAELLVLLIEPGADRLASRLVQMLSTEVRDPNRNRAHLLERATFGRAFA